MRKPELLAPAGNMEKLQAAVAYGADAVYLSGHSYGLRAAAGNFTFQEMQDAVTFAHSQAVKVYVTANIFAANADINEAVEYFKKVAATGADALIISDLGMFSLAKKIVPDLSVHISTQANTTNWASCMAWQEQGAERVVLAREVSLQDMEEIKERTEIKLEAFIHGAMCLAYSGRCLLSAHLTGRSGNRGECAHPCRWEYHLVEELRPGEYFPVEEDKKGTYIFGPADLCLLEHLPRLVEAGIHSFKIEGRMKSVHYVATVVKAYREAIDALFSSPHNYPVKLPVWLAEVRKASIRPFDTGFYFGQPEKTETNKVKESHKFAAIVREYDPVRKLARVEQRNHFMVGDRLEILSPKGENFSYKTDKIFDLSGNELETVPHPRQEVYLPVPGKVVPWSLVRRLERE